MTQPVNLVQIQKAANRLSGRIHMTPILTSTYIDKVAERYIYFKSEHLQKTGSFKVRGAMNKILCLKENMEHTGSVIRGVVTHSSGNHGQAVAWAAKELNLKASIVVPENTSEVKVSAIRSYGAQLIYCKPTPSERSKNCERIATELGYEIVHPYDDYDIIAGQGTIGLELLSQIPQLDAVVVSISGGGLTSGIATAIKEIKPSVKIFCVEPEGKFLGPSLVTGNRLWTGEPKFVETIAEGIRVQQPGIKNFPILTKYVETDVLTMNDDDMIRGMKLSFLRLKQVIEAAAGASLEAVIKYKHVLPSDLQHVAVILCGGNINIDDLPRMA